MSLFSLIVFSQEKTEGKKWYSFVGKIGEEPIALYFSKDGEGGVSGGYCYNKEEKRIPLTGVFGKGKLRLKELQDGKEIAVFEGEGVYREYEIIKGEKTTLKTKNQQPLELELSSKTREGISGKREDVIDFFIQFKKAVKNDDKKWIVAHTVYPAKAAINGMNETIENEKQLMDNYEAIFTPEYKKRMEEISACDVFQNYQGAMIGNGDVWVNGGIIVF